MSIHYLVAAEKDGNREKTTPRPAQGCFFIANSGLDQHKKRQPARRATI
jgi:hypothetical protein